MSATAPPPAELPHPHVDTNPWPPLGALGLVTMAFGLALSFSFHTPGIAVLVLGALLTLAGTVGWWRDLIHEATSGSLPTAHAAAAPHRPDQDFRLGMVLFIASEVMFFSAFFAFYFYTRAGAAAWPPPGSPRESSILVPSLLTLILVTSGLCYTFGEWSLMRERRRGLILGLALTVLLGATFVAGQAYEWRHARLHFTDNVLGNAFYLLTGFHGLHVIIGTLFITVNLWRAARGQFTPRAHFALVGAGWYWHFVDAVWILLFLSLYVF